MTLVRCGSIVEIVLWSFRTTSSTAIQPQIPWVFERTCRTIAAISHDQVLEIGDAMHDRRNWSMPEMRCRAALCAPYTCRSNIGPSHSFCCKKPENVNSIQYGNETTIRWDRKQFTGRHLHRAQFRDDDGQHWSHLFRTQNHPNILWSRTFSMSCRFRTRCTRHQTTT